MLSEHIKETLEEETQTFSKQSVRRTPSAPPFPLKSIRSSRVSDSNQGEPDVESVPLPVEQRDPVISGSESPVPSAASHPEPVRTEISSLPRIVKPINRKNPPEREESRPYPHLASSQVEQGSNLLANTLLSNAMSPSPLRRVVTDPSSSSQRGNRRAVPRVARKHQGLPGAPTLNSSVQSGTHSEQAGDHAASSRTEDQTMKPKSTSCHSLETPLHYGHTLLPARSVASDPQRPTTRMRRLVAANPDEDVVHEKAALAEHLLNVDREAEFQSAMNIHSLPTSRCPSPAQRAPLYSVSLGHSSSYANRAPAMSRTDPARDIYPLASITGGPSSSCHPTCSVAPVTGQVSPSAVPMSGYARDFHSPGDSSLASTVLTPLQSLNDQFLADSHLGSEELTDDLAPQLPPHALDASSSIRDTLPPDYQAALAQAATGANAGPAATSLRNEVEALRTEIARLQFLQDRLVLEMHCSSVPPPYQPPVNE
jgi:hypothetical protein